MREPSDYQLDRLKGMRKLFGFLHVPSTRASLRVFDTFGKELDNMITEWETEIQRRELVLASQAPPADVPFDDGDHLVEDQMPGQQDKTTQQPE